MLEVEKCSVRHHFGNSWIDVLTTRRQFMVLYAGAGAKGKINVITYDDFIKLLHSIEATANNDLVRLSARTESNVQTIFAEKLAEQYRNTERVNVTLEEAMIPFRKVYLVLSDKSAVRYMLIKRQFSGVEKNYWVDTKTKMVSTAAANKWIMLFYMIANESLIFEHENKGPLTLEEALESSSLPSVYCRKQFGPEMLKFFVGVYKLSKLKKILPDITKGCEILNRKRR